MALESAVNIVFAPELRLILILPGARRNIKTKMKTADVRQAQVSDDHISIFDKFHSKKTYPSVKQKRQLHFLRNKTGIDVKHTTTENVKLSLCFLNLELLSSRLDLFKNG